MMRKNVTMLKENSKHGDQRRATKHSQTSTTNEKEETIVFRYTPSGMHSKLSSGWCKIRLLWIGDKMKYTFHSGIHCELNVLSLFLTVFKCSDIVEFKSLAFYLPAKNVELTTNSSMKHQLEL